MTPRRDPQTVGPKILSSRRFMSKNKLYPGLMIQFTYKSLDNVSSQQKVLVLNPNWKGKLHGVTMKAFSSPQTMTLMRIIEGVPDPKEVYYEWYKKMFYPLIPKPYRTYNVDKITKLRVVYLKNVDQYKYETDKKFFNRGLLDRFV